MRIKRAGPLHLKALDIGCGEGWASTLLAQMGFAVDAVDKNNQRLDILRNKIKSNHVGTIRIFESGIKKFKFRRSRYDLIIALNLLHLLTDKEKKYLTAKIFSSLKSGAFAAMLIKGSESEIPKYFSKFDVPYLHSFQSAGHIYTYFELGKPPFTLWLKRKIGLSGMPLQGRKNTK